MSKAFATFSISVCGTLCTIVAIIIVLRIRAFFLFTHFCPECGSSGYKRYHYHWTEPWRGQCRRCDTRFSFSSNERWARDHSRHIALKHRSIRFPENWKVYLAATLHWHAMSLVQRRNFRANLK